MFYPKQILFEKGTLQSPIGEAIYNQFKDHKTVEIIQLTNHNIKQHIEGENLYDQYRAGKKILVVGNKKSLKFQTCKPSAHYQLPLVSGCMGQCEYCYLNTRLGDKPFIKVHVNVEAILSQAKQYIIERLPDNTLFEGAATSDPVPVEPYTHTLAQTITFFGKEPHGRFRFVTKYDDVDSLLHLAHNNHTEVRFSLNTDYIINHYENFTASRDKRIEASMKLASVGYPIGFLIAPVFIYPNWQEEYTALLIKLRETLPVQLSHPLTFEIISHRYTTTAKNRILEIFPNTTLSMVDEERQFKYGQFGYGKYIYNKEDITAIKTYFMEEIGRIFGEQRVEIKYII